MAFLSLSDLLSFSIIPTRSIHVVMNGKISFFRPPSPRFHSFKIFFSCLFIFERERAGAQVGEGQREGDRGSEVGFTLTAMSPM